MELVIGGKSQGKAAYAAEKYPHCEMLHAGDFSDPEKLFTEAVRLSKDRILPVKTLAMRDLHVFFRNALQKGYAQEEILSSLERLCAELPSLVLISDEIGCGIVPMDAFERKWREVAGRILTALAGRAGTVTRILFGIPQVLKEEKYELTVFFIRHGKTRGNERGSYIGVTDLPLSENGRKGLVPTKEKLDKLLNGRSFLLAASPMQRCIETARILFPGKTVRLVRDLSEMNFGEFEGKNYIDLHGDARYQAYIDSGGKTAFPGGEGPSSFKRRTMRSLQNLLTDAVEDGEKTAVIVAHGGTIMSAFSMMTKGRYFDFRAECGNGYVCSLIYENGVFRAQSSERILT